MCYNIDVCLLIGSLQSGSEEEHVEDSSLSHEFQAAGQQTDVDPEGLPDPPARRRRSFYTPRQLMFLEAAFNSGGHYPDQSQREQLARALNVTENRVQVCFHLLILYATRP